VAGNLQVSGGKLQVTAHIPRRLLTQLLTQLLNHVCLARQRTHQPEQQMNFHLGKSMNCPMRLGLSETTCPQRLREQNPVKVVFVLYDSKPSRSYSRLCLLFLLVIEAYSAFGNNCLCSLLLSRSIRRWPFELENCNFWHRF
jgi:hypothetical protein